MIARIVVGVLFILFAVVQLNDPDPWGWVFIYGATAAVTLYSAFRPVPEKFLFAGVYMILGGVLTRLPDFVDWIKMGLPTITGSMKAESPHIELTREFLGFLLCMLVWRWLYNKAKTDS